MAQKLLHFIEWATGVVNFTRILSLSSFYDLGEMLAFIVDFTFNLDAGQLRTSTLRKRVNQRDWRKVAKELRRWVYGGGVVLPGLVARREAEAERVIG
jgi:hypothetical protein